MNIDQIIKGIKALIDSEKGDGKIEAISKIREAIHEVSPRGNQPIDLVRWVPISMVRPNDYNPNSVAKKEMWLLSVSIREDGYTQLIVTIWDDRAKKYIIVDGFHRYSVSVNCEDIRKINDGMLPIVVIKKGISDRMASTVRHNRARGEHSISGMSGLVFSMLEAGSTDLEVCNKLGLEADELMKLKHITGFSALYKDKRYGQAWETKQMIRLRVQNKQK